MTSLRLAIFFLTLSGLHLRASDPGAPALPWLLEHCQQLSHLPVYWAFRLSGIPPFLQLLLNSLAFALVVWVCWKCWENFRKKRATPSEKETP